MIIYNVRMPVVALVRAASPEQAYEKLSARLSAAGFEPYDSERAEDIAGIFESEDQEEQL